MRTVPSFFLFLFTLGTMLVVTRPAVADGNLNCQAYAQAAINQQQQNTNTKCGYGGPAWSLNYNAHLNWCKRNNVRMADLTREDRARRNALNLCKLKKKKASQDEQRKKKKEAIPGCRQYAKAAVAKAKQNIKYGCNYTSSSYSTNYKGHYQWCLNVGLATAAKARAETKAGIARCKKSKIKTIKPQVTYTSYTNKKQYKVNYMVCTHPKGDSRRKCGLSAASKVCRIKGYRKALRYKTRMNNQFNWRVSAYYPGSKSACKGTCKVFDTITCLRK